MAYFVLVVGALTAIIGVDAIVTGYPIIQVERGWATVISGSTLLAAGLVMIALGLIVRVLVEIRTALHAQPSMAPQDVNVEPSAESRSRTPVDAPSVASAMPALAVVAAPAAVEAFAAEHVAEHVDAPRRSHADEEPEAAEVRPADAVVHEEIAEPVEETQPAMSSEAVPSGPADAYELQTPSTRDHDLAPAARTEASESPPLEDWLDRAFSALDHDRPAGEEPVGPQKPVPAAEPDPVHREPAQPDDAPIAAVQEEEPAPPPHEPPAPELAVIGRYESDGTSYVMYADGSIEAQSEAGVYRFGSMAELKTFIES